MMWFVCILLISAVDGSLIREIHSEMPMSIEECNKRISEHIFPASKEIAVVMQCHKADGVEA